MELAEHGGRLVRPIFRSDSSSSSPDSVGLTPESSEGARGDRDEVVPEDPLLRAGQDGGGGEVYELREGMGRSKASAERLDLEDDYYQDDDDYMESRREEGEGEHDIVYTADEERAIVRKFDQRLVLFVALLYLLSFLDRSNIGNAFVAGMDQDLLQATDPMGTKSGSDGPYESALSAFYIAYIAFEWLSLMWTVIPAHIYVSGIVLSWGVVASLQAVASSYPTLIILRFLLGIGEAGFTGIPIYLSFFFRREELALRTAVFISAAPLATAFASSLAWVITKVGEGGPIAPWRLLFLVEGFPAVLVATVAWRVIPDSPERASYLTAREKQIAKYRLLPPGYEEEGGKGKSISVDEERRDESKPFAGFLLRFCRSTCTVLCDPIPWTTAAIFFLTNVAYSSLPVFLPSILEQMGHSPLASQALAAPPYLVAFFVVLIVAKMSDAVQARAYFIAAAALASAMGYAFLALAHSISKVFGWGRMEMARYLAIYPAAVGFFCVVVLTIAWNVNNARANGHKGGAFALMQVIGQLGPLLGTRLYPKTDGPWFEKGMGVCAVAMFGVAVLAIGLRWKLARANRRMDGRVAQWDDEEEEGLVGGRFKSGDDGFRYML
ncbi:hypothetical protein N0V93_007223 [Gnomoniopsis smithogilvyi]|uniref:Major facilitator superfamily (MFS) profile domain-containing protein n=1 Tax=Gnomoniopsis smithogilvyi TaxID=1191159 RepID=A0A9W9CWD0_9PEZI|nr:hypothetical protein N0V93_007223 [Gnomoniopsis smithogilvyi]